MAGMIKGILFDKDGTLIDFYDLWLRAALAVMPVFMQENRIPQEDGMEEYLLDAIGIRQGRVDPKGPLAYKSYGEIAEAVSEALAGKGMFIPDDVIRRQLIEMFGAYTSREDIEVKSLADLKSLFLDLKRHGVAIGLATADTMESAKNCLELLGVLDCFDYIGADDGRLRAKPEPDMLIAFAGTIGAKPEEIMVVGDTYNDIQFARKCGSLAVGVLSGVSGMEDYCGEADYVLRSVADLEGLQIWQKSWQKS